MDSKIFMKCAVVILTLMAGFYIGIPSFIKGLATHNNAEVVHGTVTLFVAVFASLNFCVETIRNSLDKTNTHPRKLDSTTINQISKFGVLLLCLFMANWFLLFIVLFVFKQRSQWLFSSLPNSLSTYLLMLLVLFIVYRTLKYLLKLFVGYKNVDQ